MASVSTPTADALAERLGGAALGAYELLTVYLGDQLGLYRALSARGDLNPGELGEAAGVHPRYAREWLEQQAVAGILEVAEDGSPEERRFRLPDGYEDVLLDPESLSYIVPMARFAVSPLRPCSRTWTRHSGRAAACRGRPSARRASRRRPPRTGPSS